MKSIIVATDFSSSALNAAHYAADMALAINAEIVLLNIYQLPVSKSEVSIPLAGDEIMEIIEQKIKELKEHLIEITGNKISIETKVNIGIFFFPELKRVCESIKPYAVVMGSQGTTAAQHLFWGSHTVHAMKYLIWPLITVPREATFSTVKKIGLVCKIDQIVDIIPLDENKILVNDFKAELHLLNIDKNVINPNTGFESFLLNQMITPLKATFQSISNKNVDEVIIDFAEKNKIGLLIALPRRHGLLRRLILKSHTRHLILHSHVPVMALASL